MLPSHPEHAQMTLESQPSQLTRLGGLVERQGRQDLVSLLDQSGELCLWQQWVYFKAPYLLPCVTLYIALFFLLLLLSYPLVKECCWRRLSAMLPRRSKIHLYLPVD